MSNKSIMSRFTHMFSDGIKQEQPENTYSDAIGFTTIKGSERSGFVSSKTGNKQWIGMPETAKIRGERYMAEYDQWILLVLVGGIGEVGLADEKTKQYTTLITDSALDRPIGIQECIWTKLIVNVHASCNRIKIYFQTNEVYRVIELFDPCCDFKNTLLMKATCLGVLSVKPVRGLGQLVNGSYKAVLRVFDKDKNDTNFGTTSQPMYVADGDFRIDEVTKYGLVIEGFNMPQDYNFAELVIVENIDGADKYKVINNVGFSEGFFSYVYTGAEGYYAEGKNTDINNRRQQYFNGEGIYENEGSCFLTNVRPQRNYNLQKTVNGFRVGYKRWFMSAKYAKDWKGLRENENYDFFIWYNGKDGTRTIAYNLINHVPDPGGTVPPGGGNNCQNCDVPIWATIDTSVRTKSYADACALSPIFRQTMNNDLRNGEPESIVAKITRIKTDDAVTSISCNGSCAAGQAGGSCGGGSCGGGNDGSSGALPRSTEEDNALAKGAYEDAQTNEDIQELCEMLNCTRLTLQAIVVGVIDGLYAIANSIRLAFELEQITSPYSPPNCQCSELQDLKNWRYRKFLEGKISDEATKTSFKEKKSIKTKFPCAYEGEKAYYGQVCYECKGGYWNFINNEIHYKNKTIPFTKKGNKENTFTRDKILEKLDYKYSGNTLRLPSNPRNPQDKNPFGNNCITDIGQPVAYSEGWFGYWETNERYPDTIGRDDCLPIYGDFAGKNVRLFKVPSLGKEPHFLSLSEGVPSKQDMGNIEDQSGFVIMTGMFIENIEIPEVIKDWVCEKNPFTIGYSERTENNKTVISTGILHGTFEGQIQGQPYLFPKHAVNSWEFYDVNVNPGGFNTLRRGSATDVPAYVYHSPDYHLYGNYSDGHYALFQMELDGKGYRHGLYADGEFPHRSDQPRVNQGGARQGINLNHFICKDQPIFRCIKGMTEAPANSIVGKDSGISFTRSLVNLHREGSQYIEFEGTKVGFSRPPDGPWGSLNGGAGDNNESDNSFIGDTITHETFIKNCRAHLITVMRYLPNQYGPILSRKAIPIGINGAGAVKGLNGKIRVEGLVGDSFTGTFSYKRTGHVSDKVMEDISPGKNWDLVFGEDENGNPTIEVGDDMFIGPLQVFKELVQRILEVIGWEEIGTTPETGNISDLRNLQGGLRNGWRGMTSELSPIGMVSGGQYPDTYFPQLVKSYIYSFLTSDANLNYRGTGTVLFGDDGVAEVHRTKLKTLDLDSTMPDGQNHKKSWLNRFYVRMMEPSRWKMLLRMAINFVFTYGIGLFIIFKGIGMMSFDTSGILSLIGTVLSIIAAVFVITLGVVWINLWANTDLDNKVVDSALGLEWVYPDKIFRREDQAGQGSRFGMFPKRAVQFEDNYWYYNLTYSSVNNGDFVFGMPFYYDTEFCPKKFTNRIIASNRQNPSSEIDAWRQFKPNHYVDIPRNRGKIMDMFSIGGGLFVQTTDTIFRIDYRGTIRDQMTNDELLLGNFYMFGRSQDIYGYSQEGWAGCKDPNASRTTYLGHFFFDRDAHRFKVFTGNAVDIPFSGIEEFMDDNLKFHLLDSFPDAKVDQKCANGVHFDFGIDYGNNTIYMYKKDFMPKEGLSYVDGKFNSGGESVVLGDPKYFTDKSFLYEYNMTRKQWISRQYFRPDIILFNRYNMYTTKGNIIYSHDTKTIYNNWYGVDYPSYIEIPLFSRELYNSFFLKNIKIVGELIEVYDDGTEMELDEPLFEKYMVYNGRQSTGWLQLRDISIKDDNNMINHITQTDEKKWWRKGNGFVMEELYNVLDRGTNPISRYNSELDIMDIGEHSKRQNGNIEDDFIVLRLLSNKKHNQKIHLRKIVVTLAPEQDG